MATRRMFSSAAGLKEVVIVSTARTPIAAIGGGLSSLSAPELGAAAIKGALKKAGIEPSQVQEVIMGNVVSANIGQAPARQASKFAGIPDSAVCTTVNKVCSSGMKSVMYGAQSIMLGHHDIVVAGGMESMSNAPYYLPNHRYGAKFGHGQVLDSVLKDGLWDPYNNIHMGMCAEKTAAEMGISREEQDAFAKESYLRAQHALANNLFANEIVDVVIQAKGKETIVSVDEEPSKVNFEKMLTLKPAFKREGGTITAANASKLNDGAAALVLMSADKARELGLTPIARIRGFGDAEQAPIDFPTAPAKAVPIAMKRAGVTVKDCQLHEVNEAFSTVVLANQRILNLDPATINVFGGAVSLGHPIGCSGARIIGTLINALQQKDGQIGTASICNGGGGGSAIVIERLA